jgi:Family of unknown function (DUF6152)
MRAKLAAFVVSVVLLLAAMPVLAHHSFKAQYDEAQPITLKGTVTKLIWKNPHVLLDVDVKGGTGEVAKWELELDSPNGLISQGWKVDSFKEGDRVVVTGYRAKNGSNFARARKVTLAAR